jgi:hypothetical protein
MTRKSKSVALNRAALVMRWAIVEFFMIQFSSHQQIAAAILPPTGTYLNVAIADMKVMTELTFVMQPYGSMKVAPIVKMIRYPIGVQLRMRHICVA